MESRDSESTSEEESDEPIFKYSQVKGSLLGKFNSKVYISSCALSQDKIIVGTNSGELIIFSFTGIQEYKYKANSEITCFSLNKSCEYLVAGTKSEILIHNIKEKVTKSFNSYSINAIFINQDYSYGKNASIFVGTEKGKVVQYIQKWMSQDPHIIYQSQYEIQNIKISKYFLVWSDEGGLSIYSYREDDKIEVPIKGENSSM